MNDRNQRTFYLSVADLHPALTRINAPTSATLVDDAAHQRLELLGTLAAGITHEMNNVLTPVLAFAELARANLSDADLVKNALDRIIAGVSQTTQVSEAILCLATPGVDPRHEVTANILEAVTATLHCLAHDPARSRIDVKLEIPKDLRAGIRPVALQQVLLNLTLNARRAMQPGGGELRICAESSTGNTGVRIGVEDTGCGISPGFLPHIFDDFLSRPRQLSRPDGRGLGLPICRRLIEHAGGTIRAASTEGRGTTFTIWLPEAGSSQLAQAA